jgi:tRNA threonylcarbamoyladenosine biosynthesis protein TsaB
MLLLAIDTATSQVGVAIGDGPALRGEVRLAGARRHAEQLAPAVRELCTWTGVRLRDLSAIAVGIGPGLFTGLRVGVATGKTLAQVLTVPIVALTSLDVLAYAARATRRRIAAVIDARRGEVFFAIYRPVPGGVVRESEFTVGPPDHLVAELEALTGEVLCVGNGAILYADEIAEVGARVEFASPSVAHPKAAALVELAVPRMLREEFDRVFDVAPLYLRKPDAEIAWDERARGPAR